MTQVTVRDPAVTEATRRALVPRAVTSSRLSRTTTTRLNAIPQFPLYFLEFKDRNTLLLWFVACAEIGSQILIRHSQFYSEAILSRRGPLAKVWLAAHMERKLSKTQTLQTDIEQSVGEHRGTYDVSYGG